MQKGETATHQVHKRRPTRHWQVSSWQRAVFGLYCAIFAFVLPCICWGAYSSPGHPHRLPHFVFVTPVVDVPDPASTAAHEHHRGTDQTGRQNQAARPDQTTGQARLSLMIFSILTFVLLGAWRLVWVERRYSIVHYPSPFAKSISLPVPLPPPRVLAFAR